MTACTVCGVACPAGLSEFALDPVCHEHAAWVYEDHCKLLSPDGARGHYIDRDAWSEWVLDARDDHARLCGGTVMVHDPLDGVSLGAAS